MPLCGLIVFLVGILLILIQVGLTFSDHFLFADDMVRYHGKGLPMIWHFGIMWGDIFIALLCGVVVASYGDQWSWRQILYVGLTALVLSAVMHYQYLQDNIPNSHMHDHRLTPAAYVHFAFMWMAFTVFGLFYLCTVNVPAWAIITTSALLWIHVVLGTHLIVKLWSPAWFPPQPPADTITLVVWTGAAAVLAGFSWWSTDDWRSAITVLLACAAVPFAYFGLKGLARVPH